MNESMRLAVEKVFEEFKRTQKTPHLLVIGATGTGKSSLINAILDERMHAVNTVESTTREFNTSRYRLGENGGIVIITDSPGYGEVHFDEEYSQGVVREAAKAHAVLLVLKADEKGYDRDLRIISLAGRDPEFSLEKPLLVVLNQIDKIKPTREWEPPYSVTEVAPAGASEKQRNLSAKVALVKSQFADVVGSRAFTVVPTMADPEEGRVFGIDDLKLRLFEMMPEVVRFQFAQIARLAEKASRETLLRLDGEASRVIGASALAAGAFCAVNPVPASDFVGLVPIQVGMVIKLGALYGHKIDQANGLEVLGAMGAGFAARQVFQGIISLLPGVKNLLGPPYAAAATHGIGKVAQEYFKRGVLPSPTEIQAVMTKQLEAGTV